MVGSVGAAGQTAQSQSIGGVGPDFQVGADAQATLSALSGSDSDTGIGPQDGSLNNVAGSLGNLDNLEVIGNEVFEVFVEIDEHGNEEEVHELVGYVVVDEHGNKEIVSADDIEEVVVEEEVLEEVEVDSGVPVQRVGSGRSEGTQKLLQQFRQDVLDLKPIHVTDRPNGGGAGQYAYSEHDVISDKLQFAAVVAGNNALKEEGVSTEGGFSKSATLDFWQALADGTEAKGAGRCLHCSAVAAKAIHSSASEAGLNVYLAAIPDTDHHITLVTDEDIGLEFGKEAQFKPSEGSTTLVVDLWQHSLNIADDIDTNGKSLGPGGPTIKVTNEWKDGQPLTLDSLSKNPDLADNLAAPFSDHTYTEGYSTDPDRKPLVIFAKFEPSAE